MSAGAEYYLGLITSQYADSPEYLAWRTASMRPALDALACVQSMPSAFDVDIAVGAQQDILGQWVGVARTVGFQPSGGISPVLDDLTYRILLKATIAKNAWDGRIDSLYPAWKTLFPGGTIFITDNQNMTATITLSGSFTSIITDLIVNGCIVPRPQGVLYGYVFGVQPYFGLDLSNGFIAGLDLGHLAG